MGVRWLGMEVACDNCHKIESHYDSEEHALDNGWMCEHSGYDEDAALWYCSMECLEREHPELKDAAWTA